MNSDGCLGDGWDDDWERVGMVKSEERSLSSCLKVKVWSELIKRS